MHHRPDAEGRDLSGNRRACRPTPAAVLGRRIFVLAGLGTMFGGLAARSARAALGQADAVPPCRTQGRVGAWTYEAVIRVPFTGALREVDCTQGSLMVAYASNENPSRSRKEEGLRYGGIFIDVPKNIGFTVTGATLVAGDVIETYDFELAPDPSYVEFDHDGFERVLLNGERNFMLTLRDVKAGRSRTVPITVQPGLAAARDAGLAEMARLERGYFAKGSDPGSCQAAPGQFQGCFITTACLTVLGLPDDGWELRVLRDFRDGRLRYMRGGQEQIDLYYRVAPAINAELLERPDANACYRRLYSRYIFPAACLAALRLDGAARWFYRSMMRELMESGTG